MHTILVEEGYPVACLDTYLAMIEGNIGSTAYTRLFVLRDGSQHDVIGNGAFACAFFASAILSLNTLTVKGAHSTVKLTVEDMLRSEWYRIEQLQRGAVIIWGPKLCSDKKEHGHIGFYMGGGIAISTDGVTGIPTRHHVTYGVDDHGLPLRPIEAIYFHDKLRT